MAHRALNSDYVLVHARNVNQTSTIKCWLVFCCQTQSSHNRHGNLMHTIFFVGSAFNRADVARSFNHSLFSCIVCLSLVFCYLICMIRITTKIKMDKKRDNKNICILKRKLLSGFPLLFVISVLFSRNCVLCSFL